MQQARLTALGGRFALVMSAVAVPLMLLVLGLAWQSYSAALRAEMAIHLDALHQRREGMERMAAAAAQHVAVMHGLTRQRLSAAQNEPARDLPPTEWVGATRTPAPGEGILLAPPGRLTPADAAEAEAAKSLFPLASTVHETLPYLQWSYYFSATRRFVSIYPWADPASFIGTEDPETVLDGYFDYPIFTLSLPAQNPGHRPYWTPVYFDAGGKGLMVSYGMPVMVGDRLAGMAGTDVLLSYLADRLAGFGPLPGRLLMVDQEGNAVADPEGASGQGTDVVRAETLLGTAPLGPTAGEFVSRGDLRLAAVAVGGTPWTLILAVPQADLRAAAVARAMPLAILLGGLVLAFAVLAALVKRQFVRPAVQLARFGAGEGDLPALPSPWATLAENVAQTRRQQVAHLHQLRAMIDGLPLRAVYLDHRLIYRDANREFLEFVGLPAHQVIGKHVEQVLGESVRDEYIALAPRIRRGEVARFEGWIPYARQGRRYLQVSILPFTGLGESEPGYLTFTRDLTDLKLSEQEAAASLARLTESEARNRAVVTSALDAVIVMDDKGVTLEFNPAAEAIFGWTAAEAIGRKVGDLIVPPVHRGAHTAGMDRYLRTGEKHVIGRRVTIDGQRKDGSVVPLELTVTDIVMGGKRLFTSHLRDLTEERRMAREMEAGQARLRQVEKLSAMGSLLAGVAHELNNPLAVVMAQSSMLQDKAPDADVRRRAERIKAAADRCGRIVKSFLAMARQKPPERVPVRLDAIAADSLEMVAYGFRSAGIVVETRFAADLPEVLGDRDLLGQVVSNILINAQQALAEAGGLRRVLVETALTETGEARLTVADSGPGVSDDLRDRVFDPYFTTKAAGVGTGIGLAISRDIVMAHGGRLDLGVGPDGGAAFSILLPALNAEPAAASAIAAPQARQGWNILVVDDEPDVGESLAEMLGAEGHHVHYFDGVEAALDHAARHPVDAVFADLRMPRLDGVALIERLSQDHPALAARAVIVTGDTVAGPTRLARLPVAPVVLEKPFTVEDVRAAIVTLMG